MKKLDKKAFEGMDIRKIAEIRSAVEITTTLAGFELNTNEERLLLFVWLRNNIEETLASEDPQVLETVSNYIEKVIKKDLTQIANEQHKIILS